MTRRYKKNRKAEKRCSCSYRPNLEALETRIALNGTDINPDEIGDVMLSDVSIETSQPNLRLSIPSEQSAVLSWGLTGKPIEQSSAIPATVTAASTSLSALTVSPFEFVGNALSVSTTLTRTSAPTGALAGQTVTFTLTGPVTTTLGATTDANGLASVVFPLTDRGTYSVNANFNSGTPLLTSAISNPVTVTVYQKTQISLTPSFTVFIGTPLTLSAHLATVPAGARLSGQPIEFDFGGVIPPLTAMTGVNGVASVNPTFPTTGTHSVRVSFSNAGSLFTNHLGNVPPQDESVTAPVTVSAASTALSALTVSPFEFVGNSLSVSTMLTRTSAPTGALAGQTVTFTLTGPVTTTLGATTDANGLASVVFPLTDRGTYSVNANFNSGTPLLTSSTSGPVTFTVYQKTQISFTPVTGIVGAPMTLSPHLVTLPGGAPLSGQPIEFDFGGVIPPLTAMTGVNGVASVNPTFPTTGTHSVRVSFSNSGSFFTNHLGNVPPQVESVTAPVTVSAASTALSALTVSPFEFVGNSLSVSTTLTRTSAPTGALAGQTVTFTLSGPTTTTLGATTDANGSATVSFPLTGRGIYSVNAEFSSGTPLLTSSTSGPVTFTVYQKTQISFTPAIGIVGAPMTLSAHLVTLPGGAPLSGQPIVFDFGGVIPPLTAMTDVNGVANVNPTFPTTGTHSVRVSFSNAGSLFTNHLGNVPPQDESVTAPVTVSAASTALSALTVSPFEFVGNSLSVSTTLTRTSAPTGALAGQTVTFTLSGPTTTTLGATTDANGSATFSFPLTGRGIYSVNANFISGTPLLTSSTSGPVTFTVYQRTQISFTPAIGIVGAPMTLSAHLVTLPGGAPLSGQPIVFDFGGVIPSLTAMTGVNGVASVNPTFPTTGTHIVTTSFSNARDYFTNHTGSISPESATALVSIAGVKLAADGTLIVIGTADRDDIHVSRHGSVIRVDTHFVGNGGREHYFFNAANVASILIKTEGDDDQVHIDQQITLPATIDGGAGNNRIWSGSGNDKIWGHSGDDKIWGGKGNDIIFAGDGNNEVRGEDGNDRIFSGNGADKLSGGDGDDALSAGMGNDDLDGGSGRNLIIGGAGKDDLKGGKGEDLLIAGYTLYDMDLHAINRIMAEWTSANSYNTRLNNLRSGSGVYLSGVKLDNSGLDRTVFDDGVKDDLKGGDGRDWFFADLDGIGGDDDNIKGVDNEDTLSLI